MGTVRASRLAIAALAAAITVAPAMAEGDADPPAQKPAIALLALDVQGVDAREAKLISDLTRSYFVNAALFRVLTRDHMERLLAERSLDLRGAVAESDAVKAGKALNVDKVAVSSLIGLDGEYFMELRLIDVATSSIDKSKTDKCSGPEELPVLAKRMVERVCGTSINTDATSPFVMKAAQQQEAIDGSDERYYGLSRTDMATEPDPVKEVRRAQSFRVLGFSSLDYNHYKHSGLTVSEWTQREQRSVLLAAGLGALPVTSGFFHTRHYAEGVFLTTAKVVGVVGMIPFEGRSGVREGANWLFPVILVAATAGDVLGSTYTARQYNERLARLSKVQGFADAGADHLGAGLTLTF